MNGISVTVPVNLTLTPVALTLTPSSLTFSYNQGDPAPAAQNVVVDSPALEGSALSAFATTGERRKLALGLDRRDHPGNHVGFPLRRGAGRAQPSHLHGYGECFFPGRNAVSLPVTLTVNPAPVAPINTLTAAPAQLNFSGPAGGAPVNQTLTLTLTTSSGTVPSWSASPPPHWLSFSPSSGTMTAGTSSGGLTTYTATITAIGNPALLNAGTQTSATVTLSAGGAQVTLPVAFSALQPASFSLSPMSLSFTYQQGSAAFPSAQNVSVNSQPGSLVSTRPLLPMAGTGSRCRTLGRGFTTPGAMSVSISNGVLASLGTGTYTGSVTVSGSGAPAVTLPVMLTVTAAAGTAIGPMLSVAPTSLSFSAGAGGAAASQMATLTYTTSVAGAPAWSQASSVPWITTTPASGTFSGSGGTYTANVMINANPAGLAAGTQNGMVTFTVAGNTVAVAVNLTISQPQSLDVLFDPFVYTWRMGDPPPAALNGMVTTTPSGVPFNVVGTTNNGGAWLKVTTVSPTPGTFSAAIDPTVLSTLAPGSYVGSLNVTGTGIILPVTLAVTAADGPKINNYGVVPVYNTRPTIQPGSWISIYGDQLAPSTAVWNGDFPTTLNGVTVTVNGKPGYLWFVSPGQINLQAPDDMTQGSVTVAVTTPTGTTVSTVGLSPESPSFSLLDSKHIAAIVINPDGSYNVVGPVGAFPYPTRPVSAGEPLVLFGVGFGPTADQVPAGQPYTSATPTTGPVPLTIGGIPATVAFSGLVSAGLYQINVTVPAGLASGDQPVSAMVGEFPSGAGPVITIK